MDIFLCNPTKTLMIVDFFHGRLPFHRSFLILFMSTSVKIMKHFHVLKLWSTFVCWNYEALSCLFVSSFSNIFLLPLNIGRYLTLHIKKSCVLGSQRVFSWNLVKTSTCHYSWWFYGNQCKDQTYYTWVTWSPLPHRFLINLMSHISCCKSF